MGKYSVPSFNQYNDKYLLCVVGYIGLKPKIIPEPLRLCTIFFWLHGVQRPKTKTKQNTQEATYKLNLTLLKICHAFKIPHV